MSEALFYPIILFIFTLLIGIIAPLSGVGGGVLFVPLTAAFFPFHIDFVRGAGLIMAFTSALSSAPRLLKEGLANLKVMFPLACVSVISSVIGGIFGLWITEAFPEGKYYVVMTIGLTMFMIVLVMLTSKRVEFPGDKRQDFLAAKLDISGAWFERSLNRVVEYRAGNMLISLIAFLAIGFMAGMFGLGAGWANVPILNLVMGLPIKAATSTSMVIITINDAAASWVYLSKGAILPLIVVPCVAGMTIGARIGARIAIVARPRFIKYLVIAVILAASFLNIIKSLGGLGVIPKYF